MAKPFNDEGGSGFHLHFSTWSDDGEPLFDDPTAPGRPVQDRPTRRSPGSSRTRRRWPPLLNPTINSYKRFGPDTLAPWLIDWGLDNRSAMVRIPPERGRASRMELRLGDASANPYLAIAGAAGRGLPRHPRRARAAATRWRATATTRRRPPMLPAEPGRARWTRSRPTRELADVLGKPFVNAFLTYKRNELERFTHWVTDWEFREYAYHL